MKKESRNVSVALQIRTFILPIGLRIQLSYYVLSNALLSSFLPNTTEEESDEIIWRRRNVNTEQEASPTNQR